MAKKTTKTSQKGSPTRKKAAKRTTVAKKLPRKKKTSRRKVAKPKDSASSRSVDGILKKYEKERVAQELQLSSLQKKITELEKKTRSLEEQSAKLRWQASATADVIAQLDSRRDEEVSALLSKLGVQIGHDSTASAPPAATSDDPPPEVAADTLGDDMDGKSEDSPDSAHSEAESTQSSEEKPTDA